MRECNYVHEHAEFPGGWIEIDGDFGDAADTHTVELHRCTDDQPAQGVIKSHPHVQRWPIRIGQGGRAVARQWKSGVRTRGSARLDIGWIIEGYSTGDNGRQRLCFNFQSGSGQRHIYSARIPKAGPGIHEPVIRCIHKNLDFHVLIRLHPIGDQAARLQVVEIDGCADRQRADVGGLQEKASPVRAPG